MLVTGFTLSQFFRTFPAAVAPEMAADLHTDAAGLGTAASLFFFAFGLAQVPMGAALDRLGAGRVSGAGLLVCAAGTVGMILAPGLPLAMVAFATLGLGCAPLYMAVLHWLARHRPSGRFVPLAALAGVLGMTGSLVAAGPLAWAAAGIGWRGALGIAAALSALFALLDLALVRDHGAAAGEGPRDILRGVARAAATRALWPLLPLCLVAAGVGLAFRTVWTGPYLLDVFGLGPGPRGTAVTVVALGALGGMMLASPLARRFGARGATLVVSVPVVAALLVLALAPAADPWLSVALLALAATYGCSHTFLMAQGRGFLPDALVGRGLGLLNSLVFLGIGLVNAGIGAVIGAWDGPPSDRYGAAFAGMALLVALALPPYLLSRDPPAR
ncbi:MFS transporter [Muricoccus radiodurans]|uniref:MFS transporter n=1 Tax=Muricoccus radiodurans TaxID=2231721 RepID=UPI003CF5B444